ncbi:NAD(P)-dependent oxidoreductase [Frigidibacter sp. MR17.14]|uniref:NAD(P)-dependent oxidoreductase n=1 Tax=Frigidibacter sp. MR17.14 TaxID=3126509 RepID=UPI003012EEB2
MTDRSTPKILVVDPVGLALGADGQPDTAAVRAHVAARGGHFHDGSARGRDDLAPGCAHFFYLPHLSTAEDLRAEAGDGLYDAVIAAATFLPADLPFPMGGVRIGAGTGNMGCTVWGGGDGTGGSAPLMNTPGINAVATAQMVFKALLAVRPDLPVALLHELVAEGAFDTGRDLARFPTAGLQGRCLAVIGYGSIGREVAKLGRAFGMRVRVHARPRHRDWIEAEGFEHAETPLAAATGADVLSVHVGLGPKTAAGFANAGLIGDEVLSALAPGAVLINYDRGELVDTDALAAALDSGRLGHAAIDADLFRDAATGALSGPMLPYLPLAARFGDRLSLLPHAAADTDHPTRVAGACQAVDQILDAIREGRVRNAKGEVPAGWTAAGGSRPRGVGGIDAGLLAALAADPQRLAALQAATATLSEELARLAAPPREGDGAAIDPADGARLALAANRLRSGLDAAGLAGPWLGA